MKTSLGQILVMPAVVAAITSNSSFAEETQVMKLDIHSDAFDDNSHIPMRYTEDGVNLSPPLTWDEPPANAKSLALVMDDPDAPRPEPWVHWVLYNLAADTTALPEGIPRKDKVSTPPAAQGTNSWGSHGYRGPAPPKGHGTHRYRFTIYALDSELNLEPGTDKETLQRAMADHVVARGTVTGTYER